MRIFLLGFMGTGKSYWGERWAAANDLPFVDTDKEVEKIAGMTVADIFEKAGEDHFRKLEAGVLRATALHADCIVACGGGAPCFAGNMEWMNDQGTTVFLSAPPRYLLENIEKEKGRRPLLKNMNEAEILFFIEKKLKERMQYYSLAMLTVEAKGLSEESFKKLITLSKKDHA